VRDDKERTGVIAPVPITRLTVRQFTRAKAVVIVAGILGISLLAALIPLLGGQGTTRRLRESIGEMIYLEIFVATLLPIATLILATGALGDEIEDRTLQYLTLKPISRARIIVEKFLGVLLVAIPAAWAAIAGFWAIAAWDRFEGTRDLLWPMMAAAAMGVIGFGALFLLISLFWQRALLIGLFYSFVWESALSRFLPGIRAISIRHYTQSIFTALADDPRIAIDRQASLQTSLITLSVLGLVSLAWATVRLRRMDLE
jgi:ABC-2 type transport system permease protein